MVKAQKDFGKVKNVRKQNLNNAGYVQPVKLNSRIRNLPQNGLDWNQKIQRMELYRLNERSFLFVNVTMDPGIKQQPPLNT